MKLQNKKTGEIGELLGTSGEMVLVRVYACHFGEYPFVDNFYKTLSELKKEWQDYEEPKEYWYIDDAGVIQIDQVLSSEINMRKSIGNYFDTREEAEKAVEKLKAWKRLKDKGFRFTAWYGGSKNISYEINSLENETYIPRQICDDLDLLFRGGE